jgi:hypothetical protein
MLKAEFNEQFGVGGGRLGRMWTELWLVKPMVMRFQVERRTPVRSGLEAIFIAPWQGIWMHFIHALRLCGKPNLKAMVVSYLVEENSRQHNLQAAAWTVPSAFSQIYSQNQQQRGTEQKDLENLQFGQKRSRCV